MPAERAACWKPEHGDAVASIQAALQEHLEGLLMDKARPYTSTDMRRGFDRQRLLAHAGLLGNLLDLDARGGYFAQSDLVQALEANKTMNAKWSKQVDAMEKETQKSSAVILARIAYYIRVMLTHLRSRRRSTKPGQDRDELSQLYDKMAASVKKKTIKPCPFISFQDETEQDANSSDDEDTCIATYFDSHLKSAFQLFESGRLESPVWYEHGANGFVQCFFETGVWFDTEVPNMMFKNGTFEAPELPETRQKRKTATQGAAMRKRPAGALEAAAASASSGQCEAKEFESNSQQEEDPRPAEHDDDEAPAETSKAKKPQRLLALKAHKDGHMTICLITTGNDKAQLVEYKGSQDCERTKHIKKVLEPLIEHARFLSVKSLPKDILAGYRAAARAARDELEG